MPPSRENIGRFGVLFGAPSLASHTHATAEPYAIARLHSSSTKSRCALVSWWTTSCDNTNPDNFNIIGSALYWLDWYRDRPLDPQMEQSSYAQLRILSALTDTSLHSAPRPC